MTVTLIVLFWIYFATIPIAFIICLSHWVDARKLAARREYDKDVLSVSTWARRLLLSPIWPVSLLVDIMADMRNGTKVKEKQRQVALAQARKELEDENKRLIKEWERDYRGS